MADEVQIEKLTIEVEASASGAAKELDSLNAALSRLGGNASLGRAISNLDKLQQKLSSIAGLNNAAEKLNKISAAVSGLSSLQKASGLNSALNTLGKLPAVVEGLDTSRLSALADAVQPISAAMEGLGSIEKLTGLNSALNTLNKIPDIVSQFEQMDLDGMGLDKFAEQMNRVRDAVQPLATEMEKVSKGFASLPASVQKVLNANAKLTSSNKSTGKSYRSLIDRVRQFTAAIGLSKLAGYLGEAMKEFNSYVETMNLFTVSMGEFSSQAGEFTQKMQDVLGIDAAEAQKNMGVFQNLLTSFGLAGDRAYTLSKNMTQLGYDMSSFFNLKPEDSFQKLQAAISGELEPIRRLGVDISAARLQQELYSLGVNATVDSLNQADKAQLRYIAIMKQTTNAQMDMGRTLNSPANQMRVFNQQVTLLARSIGSLLLPALNAILPPLIAVVQVVREAIQSLAAFLGIEVEFADVSSSGVGAGASDTLTDIGDSAGAAAKKMSMLIGGFDELNVMQDNSGGGSGSGAGAGGSLLGDIQLPEYDMFAQAVESRVNEIAEKLRKFGRTIANVIEPIIPMLKGVGVVLAGAFAIAGIVKFIKKLDEWKGSLSIGTKVLSALGVDLDKMNTDFEKTGKLLASFQGAIPTWVKIGTVITTAAGAGVTAYDAMYKLTQGTTSAAVAFANIAAAAAVFSGVAYAVAGPVGVVVTALGLLTGILYGNAKAQKELDQAWIDSELYNNGGVKLEYVVAGFDRLAESYQSAAATVLENKEAYDQGKQSIADTAVSVYDMITALQSGYGNAEELVPQIASQFDVLRQQTQSNMELIKLSLSGALINAPQEALDALGINVEGTLGIIDSATARTLELEEAQLKQAKAALESYQKTGDVTYLMEAKDAIGDMGGAVNDSIKGFEAYREKLGDLSNVDFSSLDNAEEIISGIGTTADQTAADLQTAKATLLEQIADLSGATDAEKAELERVYTELFDYMIEQTYTQANDLLDSIEDSYGNSVSTGIENAIENEKPTIGDRIIGFTSFLSDTTGLSLSESIQGAQRERIGKAYKEGIGAAVDGARESLSGKMEQFGIDLNTGLADGVSDNIGLVSDAVDELSGTTVKDMHDGAWQFGSPSKTAQDFGEDIDIGLSWGIRDNVEYAVNQMNYMGNQLKAALGSIISDMQRQASAASIVISVVTEYSTRGTPSANVSAPKGRTVPHLASGGVLTSPSVVLAGEYANARSNPEIVAPQNIMRQTVLDANRESDREMVSLLRQMVNLMREGGGDTKVVVNGREVFSVVKEEARREQMRTGTNPLMY